MDRVLSKVNNFLMSHSSPSVDIFRVDDHWKIINKAGQLCAKLYYDEDSEEFVVEDNIAQEDREYTDVGLAALAAHDFLWTGGLKPMYPLQNSRDVGSFSVVALDRPFSFLVVNDNESRRFHFYDASSLDEVISFNLKPRYSFSLPWDMNLTEAINSEYFRYNNDVPQSAEHVTVAMNEKEGDTMPPATVAVVIDESDSVGLIKSAVTRGLKLSAADQAGELILDIGLHFINPMIREFLSQDAREIMKFCLAIMIHYMIDNMGDFRSWIGEDKADFVKNACIMSMQASTFSFIKPRLEAVREQIFQLSKLDVNKLKEETRATVPALLSEHVEHTLGNLQTAAYA